VIKLAYGLSLVAGVLVLHAVLQVLMSSDSERRSFSKVPERFVVAVIQTPTTKKSLALLALALLTV
jgi:chromate transport protein ChrA